MSIAEREDSTKVEKRRHRWSQFSLRRLLIWSFILPTRLRKRNWSQFSLRTLLGLSILLSVLTGLIVKRIQRVQTQQALYEYVHQHQGCFAITYFGPRWLHPVLGKKYFVSKMDAFHLHDLTDTQLSQMPGISELDGLSLKSSKITDSGVESLTRTTRLRDLDLSHTKITDAGLVHVIKLEQLEVLCLNRTQVSAEGLMKLLALQKLKQLQIVDVEHSEEDVARLRRALPQAEIIH